MTTSFERLTESSLSSKVCFNISVAELITIFRLLMIPLGIGAIFLAIKLEHPPKRIWHLALKLCWVAGVLNLLTDATQQYFGFQRYTIDGLFLGFPLDLYITISFVVGVGLCLVFWRLEKSHQKWLIWAISILLAYALLEDYLVVKFTNSQVMWVNMPYWIISDFVSISIIILGTLFIFNHFLPHERRAKK